MSLVTDWYLTGITSAISTLTSSPTIAALQSRRRLSQKRRRCGSKLGLLSIGSSSNDSVASVTGGSSTTSRVEILVAKVEVPCFNADSHQMSKERSKTARQPSQCHSTSTVAAIYVALSAGGSDKTLSVPPTSSSSVVLEPGSAPTTVRTALLPKVQNRCQSTNRLSLNRRSMSLRAE